MAPLPSKCGLLHWDGRVILATGPRAGSIDRYAGSVAMRYRKLGSTGLDISELCLGCMSYGDPTRGHTPWSLNEEQSRPFYRQALEAGITFFDTADMYSLGASEEVLGRVVAEHGHRDELVIATKVFSRMRPGPNGAGLSRKAIMTGIDGSLRRLGLDYVDLYQIHRFDPATPIDETLEALHDVVKAGKARYIGASSMHAWQFAKMLYTSRLHGWTEFVTMQDHYNLLQREEEREMLPFCADQSIGVLPWSPLARGRLARDWGTVSHRDETDVLGKTLYHQDDRLIFDAVGKIAAERSASRAQIALAWVRRHPSVSAPIIGATKPGQLDDAIAALDIELTDEEAAQLESGYTPRPNAAGFTD